MVEEGNVLPHVKGRGNCPEWECPGSRREMFGSRYRSAAVAMPVLPGAIVTHFSPKSPPDGSAVVVRSALDVCTAAEVYRCQLVSKID